MVVTIILTFYVERRAADEEPPLVPRSLSHISSIPLRLISETSRKKSSSVDRERQQSRSQTAGVQRGTGGEQQHSQSNMSCSIKGEEY